MIAVLGYIILSILYIILINVIGFYLLEALINISKLIKKKIING